MIRPFLALLALLAAVPAAAADRLALVIGNGAYAVGPLSNPANDARLMARALSDTGFEVTTLVDADLRTMREGISAFAATLRSRGPDTVALVYYAGHAVQLEGRNHLMPVRSAVRAASDVPYAAVDAQWILDLIGEAGTRLSIVILDACRNNPFPGTSRSLSGGLARMDAPRGSILAYSTAPGQVAVDGSGANSPYTAALAEAIRTPGLRIEDVFKRVRREVLSATGQQQVPWESSSLTGDFYFSGRGSAPAPGPAPGSPAPGTVFRDCPDCPEMVAIPGGQGVIGSAPGTPGHEGNEAPPTPVRIAPFALGRTEVTMDAFARFVAETGHETAARCWYWAVVWIADGARSWRDPGYPQTGRHPVVCTTYADARAYADWISGKAGVRYRLPSEAEWEYAAGGGAGRVAWGEDTGRICALANVHDSAGKATYGSALPSFACDDGHAATAPVGTFPADAFGLRDMIGNAWEFVDDCWNASHAGHPGTAASRQSGDCTHRVWKGSNFLNYTTSFRTSFRAPGHAAEPNVYGGFRLARDL